MLLLLFVLSIGAPKPVNAETPILESNANGGDFGGFEQPQYVPQARYMWFVMGQLQNDSDIDVSTFDYVAGERMKGIIFIPVHDDLRTFFPSVALVGPGLPPPQQPLPFPLPAGMGAVVSHSDSQRTFFDIFTQINFFQRAEVEAIAPVSGRYYMVVFGKSVGSARYALDIGIEETYALDVISRYPINWWEVHSAMRWSHWPAIAYVSAAVTALGLLFRKRLSRPGRALAALLGALAVAGIIAAVAIQESLQQGAAIRTDILLAAAGLFALVAAFVLGAHALTPLRERLMPANLASGQRIAIGGHDIHYVDEGPRDGQSIVLLHGFASSVYTWRLLRPVLASAGYRVIAIDQLGNGASDRPADIAYTTQQQAETMANTVAAIGIKRAHWIGHSFGARLAMQIALFHPGNVQSLTLLAPEAFATKRPAIARIVALPLIGYPIAFFSTSPRWVRTGLRMVSAGTHWLTPDVVAAYAAPLRVAGMVDAQIAMSCAPKDDDRQPVPHNHASIAQPTLVIWGERDPVFPVSDGENTRCRAATRDAAAHRRCRPCAARRSARSNPRGCLAMAGAAQRMNPPGKSNLHFDLLDALAQPYCPVCRMIDRDVRQYIDGFFYESLTVVERRAEIRAARGFCSVHGSILAGHSRTLGTAIIHQDVINDVLRGIPEPGAKRGLLQSVRIAVEKALRPQRGCVLCDHERHQERIVLETLINRFDDPQLREAFERSDGLCLPHLQTACKLRGVREDQLNAMIASEQKLLVALRTQLETFIHKSNGSYAFQHMGDEAEAPARATKIVSGRVFGRR